MFVDGRPETISGALRVPRRRGARLAAGAGGRADRLADRRRSTTPTSAACTRTRPRSSAAWRSSSAISVAAILFLPWAEQTQALLVGAVVIVAVGVLDDVFELQPLLKLAGQTVAAAIPVLNGVNVSSFTLPFVGGVDLRSVELFDVGLIGSVHLGHLLTIIGIVAVINVINLIDGVDGLAAGVCVISAAALAVIALSLDKPGRRGARGAHRGRRARLPPPRLPAGVELHGRHRLEPARLPARGDRGPGGAEDERRRRPVPARWWCSRCRSSTPGS